MVCTALRMQRLECSAGYGFRHNQTLEGKPQAIFVADKLERLEFDTFAGIDSAKKSESRNLTCLTVNKTKGLKK